MNIISNILYWISTGLLVPVIVLLIFFFIRAILLIGGFFGQYLTVRKNNAFLADKVKTLSVDNLNEFATAIADNKSTIVTYQRDARQQRQQGTCGATHIGIRD
jgi:hypothetical protein